MKILIVEDDKRIARILSISLAKENYLVTLVNDGKDAIKIFGEDEYSMVLLDLMLPNISGKEICKKIRDISSVPIIILTAKNELLSKVELLDIGADDYLTKPFELEELFARMRVLFRNKKDFLNTTILKFEELKLNLTTRKVYFAEKEIVLTKKEYDLLEYFVKNKKLVLSREKIINEVWGWDFEGDFKIIDVYINSLRKKIPQCIDYIKSIYGIGYIFGDN